MSRMQKAVFSILISGAILSACAVKNKAPIVENRPLSREEILDTKTVLDTNKPFVSIAEEKLSIFGVNGSVTPDELYAIRDFAGSYNNIGRSKIFIAYPSGLNPQITDLLVKDTVRKLYDAGIDHSNISYGTYNSNNYNAGVIVSFEKYTAKAAECVPWSNIDSKKTASNLPNDRFGCAMRANTAAMAIDKGDLIGDRKEEPRDAQRQQVGIDALRKGDLKQVNGSVKGGTN